MFHLHVQHASDDPTLIPLTATTVELARIEAEFWLLHHEHEDRRFSSATVLQRVASLDLDSIRQSAKQHKDAEREMEKLVLTQALHERRRDD